MSPSCRGVALLEAMVALTVMGSVAIAVISLVGSIAPNLQMRHIREQELAVAERLVVATSLLSRGDLDIRMGDREIGAYIVRVTRPVTSVYRIAVAHREFGSTELLVTLVHRPDSSRRRPPRATR